MVKEQNFASVNAVNNNMCDRKSSIKFWSREENLNELEIYSKTELNFNELLTFADFWFSIFRWFLFEMLFYWTDPLKINM